MKKTQRLATILYFLILFAVPCYIIYDYHNTLSSGEIYKIEVVAYDPYDPFRGRYVAIQPALMDLRWRPESIQLIKSEDDFVVSINKTDHADAPGYIKKFTLERYYMNEKIAPLVEERQRKALEENDFMYVVIKVKQGRYAIEGLYINDIPAEVYVQSTL